MSKKFLIAPSKSSAVFKDGSPSAILIGLIHLSRIRLYIDKIANIEKKIPLEWIDVENNYVKQELIDYLKPLIQGEVKQIYKDGLPQHITLK